MFHAAYQDGDSVEVFTPSGKDPAVAWNLRGKVARLYDKGVKGYVLAVSGNTTSKMQIPKNPKGTLGLRQRYLVLQVLTSVSPDKSFSLELGVTDTGGTRRRLVLSSSFRTLHCTPLHAQIPLYGLESHRGCWRNLSVDLAGLTLACFRADAFKTLDTLAVGPTCRVRKIFTMRGALHVFDQHSESIADGDEGSATMEPLPVRMAFPGGVKPAPRNWVIDPTMLRSSAKPKASSSKPVREQVALRTRQSLGASQIPTPVSYPSPSPRATTSSIRREESSKSSPTIATAARMTPSPLGVRRVSPTTPGTVATPLLSRQRSVPASATHEMDSSGSLLPPELISRKIQSTEGLPSPAPAPRLGNGSPLSSRRPGLASPKVASDMASEFSTRQSTMLAHDPSKSTVSESSVVCDRNGKGLGLPARRRLAAARGTLKIATNAAVRQDYQTESYVHSSSGSPSIRRRTPKRQVCAGLVRPSSCGGRKERNGEGIACEKSFVDGKWNDSGQQGEQSTSRSLRGKRLEASNETCEYSSMCQSPVDRRDSTVTAGAEGILDSIGIGKQHAYHRDENYPERPRSCRGRGRSRNVNEVDQTSTRLLPKLSPSSAAYDANRDYVEPVGGWHPRVIGDGRGYVCHAQHSPGPPDVSDVEVSKRRNSTEGTFPSERECNIQHISSTPLSRSLHPDQRNNTSTVQTSNESDESTSVMCPSARVDVLQRLLSPSASDVHSPGTQVGIGEAVETDRRQRPRPCKVGSGKSDAHGEQVQHDSSLCVEGYATDALERLLVASEISSREVAVSRGVPVSGGVDDGIRNGEHDDDATLAGPRDIAEGFNHVQMEDNMADEEGHVAKGQGVRSTIGGKQGMGAETLGTESIRTRARGLGTPGRGNLNDTGLPVETSGDVCMGGGKCTVNPGGDEAEKLNFLPDSLRDEDSSCLLGSSVRRSQRYRQGAHRDELEELEMKELALVDLEDSYISEFGSLSLSRSLDGILRAHDSNDISPRNRKKTSSACDDEDSKGASALHGFSHRGVRGKDPSLPHVTDGNDLHDEDIDSVVRGSPESLGDNGTHEKYYEDPTKTKLCEQIPGTSSSKVPFAPSSGVFDGVMVAPGKEISEDVHKGGRSASTGQDFDASMASARQPREAATEEMQSCSMHVESVVRGTQALSRGGKEAVPRAVVESLMYDPVLNCLYDKATDEYFGLT